MDWTELGAWLIGVGAAATVAARILGAPASGRGGLNFSAPLAEVRDRVLFGVEAAGLLVTGTGAVMLAIVEFPGWPIAVSGLGALAVAAFAVIVWKQHEHRVFQLNRIASMVKDGSAEDRWRLACVRRCATWQWCLRHPFEGAIFPDDCRRNVQGAPEAYL